MNDVLWADLKRWGIEGFVIGVFILGSCMFNEERQADRSARNLQSRAEQTQHFDAEWTQMHADTLKVIAQQCRPSGKP